jgi:hypothetical protein
MENQNYYSKLEQINRLDPRKNDHRKFVEMYHELTDKLFAEIMTTKIHELYFRVRTSDQRLKTISELGPPPAHLIKGYQRCNPPHRPMFYSSSKRLTALMEARPKVGQTVYLSQWQSRHPLPVNVILQPQNQRLVRATESIAQALFHAHVDTIFTRRVHEVFSEDYKPCAALTEVLTTKFGADQSLRVGDNGLCGLRYPSVFDREGSYNTAFDASFSRNSIYPIHVIEAEIKQVTEEKIDIDIKDTAFDFDGKRILWTGDQNTIPVPYEGLGIGLRNNGKKWLVDVRSKPSSSNEIADFLNEDFRWEVKLVPGQKSSKNIACITALTPNSKR